MKRCVLAVVAVGLPAVCALVLLLVAAAPEEPVYGGKKLSEWLAQIHADEVGPWHPALGEALRGMGPAALPHMVEWLGPRPRSIWQSIGVRLGVLSASDRLPRRDAVVVGFQILGADAEGAIPNLARMLRESRGYEVSHYCAEALAGIGRAAVPFLIDSIDDAHPEVKEEIVRHLGRLGTNAVSAIPTLMRVAQDGDPRMRADCLIALGYIGAEANTVLPLLRAALAADEYGGARAGAAEGLGAFGKVARDSVPDLARALRDRDWSVRIWAVNALGRIAEQADISVPAILELLRNLNSREVDPEDLRFLRRAALWALGCFDDPDALRFLQEASRDTDALTREEAISSLSKIEQRGMLRGDR